MDALSQYIAENEPIFVYDQKADLVRTKVLLDLKRALTSLRQFSVVSRTYMGFSPVTTADYRNLKLAVRGDNLEEIELVSWWGQRRAATKFLVSAMDQTIDCSSYAYTLFAELHAYRLMLSWTQSPLGIIDEPVIHEAVQARIRSLNTELAEAILTYEADIREAELDVRQSLGGVQPSALA